MFFGVRLGPFRVGASSKGRVYGGVNVGPFSVSAPLNSGRRGRESEPQAPFYPIDLDQAVAEVLSNGWRVSGRGDGWALVSSPRGWRAIHIEAVPGGVTWRPATSNRKVVTLFAAAAVLLVLFYLVAELLD